MATLKQLKTFITVAETKKMSTAAKKLYLAQPTVSQIISDLEQEYGVALFERSPKQLEITPMGKLFWEQALAVMTSYENLNQFMKNSNEIRTLRIGATLTIGDTMISNLVSSLNKHHTDIETSVTIENTRNLEHRLVHNELDLAFVEGIITNETIMTTPIIEDELQLIFSPVHPFFHKDTITTKDLHNQNFIMREAGSGTRELLENLLKVNHIPIHIAWESCSATAIIHAVSQNLGIAVVSKRYLSDYDSNRLCTCSISDMPIRRNFYLCYNRCHTIHSQMTQCIDLMKSMP